MSKQTCRSLLWVGVGAKVANRVWEWCLVDFPRQRVGMTGSASGTLKVPHVHARRAAPSAAPPPPQH